ncbi:DUF4142 domain-containing protein [Cyclobacterium jeungdonense]|uniref:DUF4142 domain-containing protein n=1 Tax=Cyclobacterium jeungdonense TaxID=708087 RepID=A0ABT8C3R8_9BACT|nr:DUF4142 domain-containing protein [Cyclobacterium jeungdonense]MDN3686697.1 DUF4142 domain-containing protein [Cyclobacterium jeungdonense]
MKNPLNFKSVFVHSLWMAGLIVVVSACSDNKTSDLNEVTNQEDVNTMAASDNTIVVIENDNDSTFLRKAAEMQLEMINLGKLAQEKGNSAEVKELGRVMESENTKYQTEINALAQSKSVSMPSSATDDSMEAYNDLNEETGNDFSKSYSDRMVDQHEDAIDLFENAANDSEDPEIKAWASEKLPTLRTHLKLAEDSKEKSDNQNS